MYAASAAAATAAAMAACFAREQETEPTMTQHSKQHSFRAVAAAQKHRAMSQQRSTCRDEFDVGSETGSFE